MKTSAAAILASGLILQSAQAIAGTYPMNGTYWVRASSADGFGIQCRSMIINDPLGQIAVKMRVISDASGVFVYNDKKQLKLSFRVSDGYSYDKDTKKLVKGRRSVYLNDKKSFVVDGGKREPGDIGFGPIKCEFPKI